jgi:hypothetical protein
MALKNIVAAGVLLVLGAAYGSLALLLPVRDLPNLPGPSFFPLLIAALVVGLSLALLWQGVQGLRGGAVRPDLGDVDRKPAVMLAAFAAYLAALPLAGFLVASIPFAALLIRLFGGRNRLLLAAVSIGLPIFLFVLFREVFGIILPTGAYALFGG